MLPPALHPRHHIDIELPDLAFALASCGRGLRYEDVAPSLERGLDASEDTLAVHSVRSGFDLLLSALALPPGSEVLLSALTIPDMARIVRAHDLVPVPVDIDETTLSPTLESLRRAWSPKARVLVVAQLFGARADLRDMAAFARERGLLLVDDDAQGYTGPARLRESDADVVFHSFGSIKTSTCLGGGLARVRETSLRQRMRALHQRWPVHESASYAKKIALYTSLLLPREPKLYGALAAGAERFASGIDAVIMKATRGFPSSSLEGFLTSIRKRPAGPLLALLQRRLARPAAPRVEARREAGELMCQALDEGGVSVLGRGATDRTHWLFAVLLSDPAACIPALRQAGFDAARGTTSITAVDPVGKDDGRPAPAVAQAVMERVLFVPVYPEIPRADRERLARCLTSPQRRTR